MKVIIPSEMNQTQKDKFAYSHLNVDSKTIELIEVESTMVIAKS
jgi:hypothetical protein